MLYILYIALFTLKFNIVTVLYWIVVCLLDVANALRNFTNYEWYEVGIMFYT